MSVPQVILQIWELKIYQQKSPSAAQKSALFLQAAAYSSSTCSQSCTTHSAKKAVQIPREVLHMRHCQWGTVSETIDTLYLREKSQGDGHNLAWSARTDSQTTHYGREIKFGVNFNWRQSSDSKNGVEIKKCRNLAERNSDRFNCMGCAMHNFVRQWHQMIEIPKWRDSKSTMLERLSVWHKHNLREAPTQ